MSKLKLFLSFLFCMVVLNACVTINVYFPAAAAEKAADQIIDQVWGEETGKTPEEEPSAEPSAQSSSLLDLLIPAAHASADIDISSPEIRRLNASMAERYKKLETYYDNGAIGLTNDGFVDVRDAQKIGLRDRSMVNREVSTENRDRRDLYREIARANGRPDWENSIRETFAKRWIERAKSGWWYQDSRGQWVQKR